jgi:hypothetical protein
MISSLKYENAGKRDLRFDWLRGFAIFGMSVAHVSIASYYDYLYGNSQFLTSVTEMFFFMSGFLLGLVSVGRQFQVTMDRIVRRTWQVYLVTVSIAFGFGAALLLARVRVWGELPFVYFRDITDWVVRILTLMDSFHFSNILILYVFFLAASVFAMWALQTGRTWYVVAVSMGIYLLSYLDPELTRLPFATFRHLGFNNPVFFLAMVLGYHNHQIEDWWHSRRRYVLMDAIIMAFGAAGIVGFIYIHVNQVPGWRWLESYDLATRMDYFPLLNLLLTFFYLRVYLLFLTYFWKPLDKLVGWFFRPMGERALEAFWIHLVAIPLFYLIPGLPEKPPLWLGTLWVSLYLALFYGLFRLLTWWRYKILAATPRGRVLADWLPFLTMVVTLLAFIAAAIIYVVPDYVWQDKLPFLFPN